jgi:hypothetical protein
MAEPSHTSSTSASTPAVEVFDIDTTGNPLDRISRREYEALQEVKKHAIASNFTDKEIMLFMFPMKFDAKRTTTMMEENVKFRKEHNVEKTPERAQICDKIIQTGMCSDGDDDAISMTLGAVACEHGEFAVFLFYLCFLALQLMPLLSLENVQKMDV